MTIPLWAVVWSSHCSASPLCCFCCQLGKQVRQEDAPAPHEQNLCWEGRGGSLAGQLQGVGPPQAKARPGLLLPLSYALMNNSRRPLTRAQVHGVGGCPCSSNP